MHIVICGAGQVGFNIARQLEREGNTVTLVDRDIELIQHINETLDVTAHYGFASHPSVLQRAGMEEADMLIAVTYSDEVNMVACQIAHSLFNVPMKIARIRHQDYLRPAWQGLFSSENMPIDVIISPEVEVAEAILRRLRVPGALDSIPFASGKLRVMAIMCEDNCPLNNLPMQLVEQRIAKHEVSILGIVRDDKFSLPKPGTILLPRDVVYTVCRAEQTRSVLEVFGHTERAASRIVILGGGNIGLYLAQALEEGSANTRVKVIEMSRPRAEAIVGLLEHTTVINGSGLDSEILLEAGIDITDTIITVTNDDKVNILASLLAKRLGSESCITLVNNNDYIPMLSNLGIDVIVNPRETTISSILQYIRRGKIRNVYSLKDGIAEIIEAEAVETSPMIGKSIDNLNLPKGVRVGALLRRDTIILPGSDEVIHEKDIIIMVSPGDMVKKVEQFFSVSLEYF